MAQGMAQINVWPGKITQIIDPHYFWMHFGTNELLQQFELLQREILQFCKANWTNVDDSEHLQYGQVVLIDTGVHDGPQYRRGQVTRMTSTNSVDVFYVDYGNTELKTTDCICVNFPPHFKKWPPQAVRCSLAGIVPISKNWTSRATKTFQKITEGKLFQTLVLYGEPGFCEVSLYPSDGNQGRSVSHLLLDEDLAMPADGKEVPEYLSEIMEFMSKSMPQDMMHPPETQEDLHQPDIQSTTSLPSKPSERYVPPQRKNMDFSLNTSLVPRESSNSSRLGSSTSIEVLTTNPGTYDTQGYDSHGYDSHGYDSHKSMSKHSPKGLHLNTGLDKNKPVNDFFPFATVSTYPPTPTSPVKSPIKSTASQQHGGPSEQSYFSRSPKQEDIVIPAVTHQNYTSRGDTSRYSGQHEPKPPRQRDHRFAANLNNLPSPGHYEPVKPPVSVIGTSLRDGQNAAANLEPSYLNSSIPDRHDPYHSAAQRSPKSYPDSQHSPSLQNYTTDYRPPVDRTRGTGQLPFYPPNQYGDEAKRVSTQMNQASYGPQSHVNLVPPGFYTSPPPPLRHDSPGEPHRSPPSTHMNGDYNHGPNNTYRSPKKDQHEQYSHHGNTGMYNHHGYEGQYSRPGGYPSPQKYTNARDQYSDSVHTSQSRNNPNSPSKPQLKVRLPETTPTKPLEKRGKSKMSPVSPDSADIGEFNIGDIDHARFTSADYFGQRVHEEKMMALQEEAEDIAAESKEQFKLVEMARYGAGRIEEDIAEAEEDMTDIFEQIADEITSASTSHSKEFEELKRSPIKRNRRSEDGSYVPPKLESIPAQYIADIDFAEAIKEALEFSREDGMENAKCLLDGIMESMKRANVEKQLYDVLMLMLAKAIKDYNLFHRLILDSVNHLNVEMEIKECLGKVLKRQQELFIRLPINKNPFHLNCARIMGHLFVMSHDWMDCNSTIQDTIMATAEKWIVFNNKGSQIGQTEKENLFLDCFGAFWEVAGARLTDWNYTFRTRLQNEIKKKILNENVSRPVRERLLNILLELFVHCVQTTSIHTQTSTRTMIPSSCQVKPSVINQGTMTKPIQFDDDYDYNVNEYTQKWEFLSSNTSPDDYRVNQMSHASQNGTKHDTQSVEKSDALADVSYQSTNADTSLYITPNESMNEESENSMNISADKSTRLSTVDVTSALTKEVSSIKIPSQSSGPSTKFKGTDKSFSNIVRSNSSKAGPKHQTVSASISASGRSIVDWFDYDSPSVETGNITKPVTVKSEIMQTQSTVDKSEIETAEKSQKYVEEDKTYPEVSQKTAKSAKTKKHKKHKKSSPNKDSVTSTPDRDNNSQIDMRLLEAYIDPVCVTNSDQGESVDVDERVNVGESVPVCETDEAYDNDVDWWGKEEAANPTDNIYVDNIYVDTGPDVIIEEEDEEVISDNLDVDSGAGGDNPLASTSPGKPHPIDTTAKLEHDFRGPLGNESRENNERIHASGEASVGNTNFTDVKFVLPTPASHDYRGPVGNESDDRIQPVSGEKLPVSGEILPVSGEILPVSGEILPGEILPVSGEILPVSGEGVSVEELMDEEIQKLNDEYAFDTDSDDDYDDDNMATVQFDDNMATVQFDDNIAAVQFDQDFPESNLHEEVHLPSSTRPVHINERVYNRDFPRSNLRDYLPPILVTEQASQPAAPRWDPKKRICLTCHSDGHITENCTQGFVLLQ